MKTISRGVEFEILLQTVTLTPNKTSPDNIYLFRCYHCGTGISKIKGNITSIIAGQFPTSEVDVFTQCHICKENYTFKTVKPNKTAVTKLILTMQPGQTPSDFRCVICRTILIQYTPETVRQMTPMRTMRLPSPLTCNLESCGKEYLLDDIVSVVE